MEHQKQIKIGIKQNQPNSSLRNKQHQNQPNSKQQQRDRPGQHKEDGHLGEIRNRKNQYHHRCPTRIHQQNQKTKHCHKCEKNV